MATDKLSRLKAQLLTSGLSRTDRPLCQVIEQLIDSLQNMTNELVSSGVIGGGGGGGINSGTVLTADDETTTLPNSRQLLEGSGIQFNDAQSGRRFISSVSPFAFDGLDGDEGLIGPSGIQGIQGIQGIPGTSGSGGGSGFFAVDGEDGDFEIPIQIGNNGKSFKRGSVIFSDGNNFSEDNGSFFWDIINKRIGIGTPIPSKKLDIIDQTDFQMTFEGNAGGINQAHLTLYAATDANGMGVLVGKRAKGSIAGPTGLITDDELLRVGIVGYHSGGAFDLNRRVLTVKAAETWTSTAMGYYWEFLTRPNGTAAGPTERLRITDNGNLLVGATNPTTGTIALIFGDGTAPSGMGSNNAGTYANDVGGIVNMFAINESGESTRLSFPAPQTYTESNVTTDRALNANSTSIDELADVVGTLIGDLRARGIVG